MNDLLRKLPIGIQTFEKLRKGDYLYVDKTELVWKIAYTSTPYFLSRPRRFGKSLLLSTFEANFEGKKELFEGDRPRGKGREHPSRRAGLQLPFSAYLRICSIGVFICIP